MNNPGRLENPDATQTADAARSTTFVSICVPTYNRMQYLDEFLSSIAGFKNLKYELVISDNASQDDTAQVIEKWQPQLMSLCYFRQERTLSAPENVCAACNAARGDYIFNISDDDLPVEEGLLAAKRLLDRDPSCAAVYGSWEICDENFEKVLHRTIYGPETTRIGSDRLVEMFQSNWTVELPIFRREIYQRHIMGYAPELPLDLRAAVRFARYGDLVFIPDLVAKVRSHSEQDSRELYGARLLQAYLTDYEHFLSEVPGLGTAEMVSAYLHKCIKTYLSAAVRATDHGKFLEARRMIKKAASYRMDGVQSVAITFEKTHFPAVLAEYIFELCRLNPAVKRLFLESSRDAESFRPQIATKLAGRATVVPVSKTELLALPADEAALVITQDAATMAQRLEVPGANPAKHRCLDDIVEACSLF